MNNVVELTNEQRHSIYERQSGMCAFTGKKFEEFTDTIEVEFIAVSNSTDTSNIVMVWKQHSGLPKENVRKYLFPYANFLNYDTIQKAEEFKADVDEIVTLSNTDDDYRYIKNRIKELTNYLNSIGLNNSTRNEFREHLRTAINNLTQREREIREKDKADWKVNYDAIKEKVSATIEFARSAVKFKDGKGKLLEVQKELRSLKLSRTDKSELDALLNNEFRLINEKLQNWSENNEMEIIENYHSLRNLIDDIIQKAFSFETFIEAKNILIELQNQIRGKSLRKTQKDEFFSTIRNTFDELREKFSEYKRVTAEEGAKNYNIIKPQVDFAVEFAKNASVDDANVAREKLIQIQNIVKEARLKKEQKDELFGDIREIFTNINEMSNEERKKFDVESEANYKDLLSKIEITIVDIENTLDFRQSGDDLSSISTALQLAKLKRTHRERLYDKLRAAYDLLNNKHDEYNKHRFTEKKNRLTETLESLKQKNERTAKLLAKDKELLNRQQEKFATIPEDNVVLKGKNQAIIDEIMVRINDRKKSISNAERRIIDIEKEIEKTIKLEKEIEKRKEKRTAQHTEREANITKENSTENDHSVKTDNQESTELESIEAEPTELESIEAEPTELESIEAEPTELESIEAEPTEAESIEAEPIEAEPIEAEPTEATE